MHVLVTGAGGFIGRHIAATLRAAGHRVVCAGRDTERMQRMFPDLEMMACDFNRDHDAAVWLPRLAGIDAVVNCVGILQSRHGQSLAAIHAAAPKALFDACLRSGVRRVLHVSALGIGPEVTVEYSQSKLEADRYLQSLDLDWIILRPSLVYSPAGSFGGTSLFRALAALPWFIPLVGDGRQMFQPVHMADLAEAVRRLLENDRIVRRLIEVVGPEAMPVRDILAGLRRWLGLSDVRFLQVPIPVVRLMARAADILGGAGPVTATSLTMMQTGNTADIRPFVETAGISPRRWDDALASEPAHVQDRWHARLYFLRPLLRITIGLFWLFTGLTTLLIWPREDSLSMLRAGGIPTPVALVAFHAGWAFDVVVGIALLRRHRVHLVGAVMIAATLAYLVFLSIGQPWQWIHPVTPLAITIPLMIATLVMMAIEDDR